MIELSKIKTAIEERNAKWEAADTPIFRRGATPTGDSSLFGLNLDDVTRFAAADRSLFESVAGALPPKQVDWRKGDRACVTPIKDQGQCGACVAFATCAVMESSSWLRNGHPTILSEGHLFHCNGGSCTTGWGLTSGLDAARNGVGLDQDLPWNPASGCKKIPSAVTVTQYRGRSAIEDRKRAIAQGPVLAAMRVFEDFLAYNGGIYAHVAGDQVGNHAICVVGYDDDDQCWIIKNSWGPGFGEDGFFRLAYGQCGLDGEFLFFSAETT